jgi:hypothetical protein
MLVQTFHIFQERSNGNIFLCPSFPAATYKQGIDTMVSIDVVHFDVGSGFRIPQSELPLRTKEALVCTIAMLVMNRGLRS